MLFSKVFKFCGLLLAKGLFLKDKILSQYELPEVSVLCPQFQKCIHQEETRGLFSICFSMILSKSCHN